jgi:hypothetical protein
MKEAELAHSVDRIEKSIFLIRGQRVMVDSDLAALYGVTTKRLNEQVRREEAPCFRTGVLLWKKPFIFGG